MLYLPFDVGDEVKIGGVWGWVDSISLSKIFAFRMYLGKKSSISKSKNIVLTPQADKTVLGIFLPWVHYQQFLAA